VEKRGAENGESDSRIYPPSALRPGKDAVAGDLRLGAAGWVAGRASGSLREPEKIHGAGWEKETKGKPRSRLVGPGEVGEVGEGRRGERG